MHFEMFHDGKTWVIEGWKDNEPVHIEITDHQKQLFETLGVPIFVG